MANRAILPHFALSRDLLASASARARMGEPVPPRWTGQRLARAGHPGGAAPPPPPPPLPPPLPPPRSQPAAAADSLGQFDDDDYDPGQTYNVAPAAPAGPAAGPAAPSPATDGGGGGADPAVDDMPAFSVYKVNV